MKTYRVQQVRHSPKKPCDYWLSVDGVNIAILSSKGNTLKGDVKIEAFSAMRPAMHHRRLRHTLSFRILNDCWGLESAKKHVWTLADFLRIPQKGHTDSSVTDTELLTMVLEARQRVQLRTLRPFP